MLTLGAIKKRGLGGVCCPEFPTFLRAFFNFLVLATTNMAGRDEGDEGKGREGKWEGREGKGKGREGNGKEEAKGRG